MSGSEFPHFRAGKALPRSAAAWNALVDAAREARSTHKNVIPSGLPAVNPSTVLVKNNSGSDVPLFGVLGVGDVQITQSDNYGEFINRVYMSGEEPEVGTHDGKFCIALEPIATGGVGRAAICGAVHCKLTVNNDAHGWATITDGDVTKLSSQGSGKARILWKAGSSGDQWATVVIEPFHAESFWAKITGNATNGSNKWKYAWTEQQRTAGGFHDLPGGRTGTTSTDFAINSLETNNDGTGVQGNSIDIDGAVFTDNSDLEIQPVQGDPVVRMWAEISNTGTLVYTFEYVNAVDGECA